MTKAKALPPTINVDLVGYDYTNNYVYTPQTEDIDNTVLTIPDDSYKIADLLVKFTNGVLPEEYKTGNPVYNNGDHNSEDQEKLMQMDLHSMHKYMHSTNERILRLRQEQELLAKQNDSSPQTTNDDEPNDDE